MECKGIHSCGEEISSCVASEFFSIAETRPVEAKVQPKGDSIIGTGDGYDDIESLMGDYFEDIKITGSDCGED